MGKNNYTDPFLILEDIKNNYNYSHNSLHRLREIFSDYLNRKKETIVDVTISAANLHFQIQNDGLDPLAIEAIKLTNPNFEPSNLDQYAPSELMGIINSSKGKYFELLVVDKLNNGESVGDLILPNGFTAEIADTLNQPGWDIKILNPKGEIADYLQVKATDNISYVKDALDKYPDISILTTDEVADFAKDADGLILDSDISDSKLENVIHNTLDNQSDGFVDNFLDVFNPLVPLLIIMGIQGYKVYIGKNSIKSAIMKGSERASRSIFSSGFGSIIYAIGGGFLSIPTTIAAGFLFDRIINFKVLYESFYVQINNLKSLKQHREWLLNKKGEYGFLR